VPESSPKATFRAAGKNVSKTARAANPMARTLIAMVSRDNHNGSRHEAKSRNAGVPSVPLPNNCPINSATPAQVSVMNSSEKPLLPPQRIEARDTTAKMINPRNDAIGTLIPGFATF